MNRRISVFLFALILAMALTGCATKESISDDIFIDPNFVEIDSYDMTLTVKGNANQLVTTEFLKNAVLNPWRENASNTAKATNTMRFYGMCATGHSNSPSWGDSCLIAFPNGELMLLDSGLNGFSAHLVRNLRALGVEKIDYLVFSHPHDDHCYGAIVDSDLLDAIEVGMCIFSGTYNDSWGDKYRVENVMKAHDIPVKIMAEGDSMDIGEVHLQWLAPEQSVVGTSTSGNTNVNNLSSAIRFDWGEFSALMAGDIEYLVETRLIKAYKDTGLLDVDLFKISHHGSETSNSKDFLQCVTPDVAFAYGGSPIASTLYGNLAKLGTRVYCDTLDGYMRFVCTSDGIIEVSTSHPRETTVYDNLDKVAQQFRQAK